MRIALAQIDATVGDFAGNASRIRAAARATDASLVVFPELSTCGYYPRDLLDEPSFLSACRKTVEALAADRDLPALLVGAPWPAEGPGKPLWNAALLLRGGRVTAVAKSLLPSYDVFDERRHFRPADRSAPLEHEGRRIGVTICEDIWTGELYDRDPVAELKAAGAEAILNLSASPWEHGKAAARLRVAREHVSRHGLPFLLCNMVGGNDHVVFDGASFALDGRGRLCCHLAAWREETRIVDFSSSAAPPADSDDLREAILLGMRDYFAKTGSRDALVGMSGGIDSSLVACLAAEAFGPGHVTGIAMPGPFSAPASLEDARALAKTLGIRFLLAPIVESFDLLRRQMKGLWGDRPFDVAEENLQARLRALILMSFANKERALVLVPSNKSELAMGYCTIYGDMVGALAPIADLYKGEVYALARRYERQIPRRCVERAPSAELKPNQTDQDTLPPYDTLDAILRLHVEERRTLEEIAAAGFERETAVRVLRAVSVAEFKRQQGAVVLKLSRRAFGLGRRYPIAERFRGGAT